MASSDSYAYSSDNDNNSAATAAEYVDLVGFDNYEISAVEPFTIRRKDNKHVMKEYIDNNGYAIVALTTQHGKVHRKMHRLIAQQFLPNPNNLPEVDHIDRDKLNNSLNNLRWVSRSDNNRNRTVKAYGKREYLDHAPNDITEILLFNDVAYDANTYYFCYDDDHVYKRFHDHKWQKIKQTPYGGYLQFCMVDSNQRSHKIYAHKIIKHFRSQAAEQVDE